MAEPGADHETEVKIKLESARQGRLLLAEAGFSLVKPRVFEANTVFDTADLNLRSRRCLLRLRQVDGRCVLTYKGPSEAGKYKSREELESDVSDPRTFAAILERLGYSPVFRYQKYRGEFAREGEAGVATLDETPIGVFLELEGSPEWIDGAARRLGFDDSHYITASYAGLYRQYCAERGIQPTHMVFES